MEPPYINRMWLQGLMSTRPIIKALSATTNLTSFQLSMAETWLNADGKRCERKNRVTVEVVGRDSAYVAQHGRIGAWVTLEGYIRSEQFKGQDSIKVRTFSINIWELEIDEQLDDGSPGPGGAPP